MRIVDFFKTTSTVAQASIGPNERTIKDSSVTDRVNGVQTPFFLGSNKKQFSAGFAFQATGITKRMYGIIQPIDIQRIKRHPECLGGFGSCQ